MKDGSVLLSCKTTLQLGLIQPRPRLDYLPPRTSLISSSADHPKKTKAVLHTQKQEVSAQTNKARSGHSNTNCQETCTQADNKQGNDPV